MIKDFDQSKILCLDCFGAIFLQQRQEFKFGGYLFIQPSPDVSCAQLKFNSNSGIRQRDTLSPSLFNIFIKDFIVDLDQLKFGLKICCIHGCITLYVVDMGSLAMSNDKLQKCVITFI